ncbi:hypothetical protein OG607_40340 [Streptomyces sp. NBC_01537]|uniref:hypothetical protein n=1 Tax=Streptomyces sp. NBC_01537 TaxID=2903896 RepID=UPI0038669F79
MNSPTAPQLRSVGEVAAVAVVVIVTAGMVVPEVLNAEESRQRQDSHGHHDQADEFAVGC